MKAVLIFVAIVVLAFVVLISYWGIRLYFSVQVSKKLIDASVPYRKEVGDYRKPMLVLGDSTAVGVGANAPEDTVAARAAAYLKATNVENYAVSGAVVQDLPEQIALAKSPHYDLILIQIGANNIIRFDNATTTSEKLGAIIDTLPEADKIILISAGDVGGAPMWPPPLRPIYTKLNVAYHAAFGKMGSEHGVRYVNLGEDPSKQLILEQPEVYLAADTFHPSTEGYGLWFEAIRPQL